MATRSYATNPPTQAEVDAYGASQPYGGWAPSQAQKYGSLQNMLDASSATANLGPQRSVEAMTGAGAPKMVPYTPGQTAGILPGLTSDPNLLGSLFGKTGASTALAAGKTGAVPAPIDGPGGSVNTGAAVGPMGQLPPYLLQQAASGLSSDLAGQVPADVQNLLEQQSAEYGVGSGTQGSQFQGYRGLKNLGLTSLDMRKHAEDILAGQFTNPAEQARIDLANKQFGEGTREFGITQAQREKEFKAQQDLAQQKFAEEQNRLQQDLQLQELQSLGLKYGGGGSYGGALPNFGFGQQGHFNYATGTSDVY